MYERILVAFDNSPSSMLALQKSCEIAEKFNSELIVVTVVEPLDVFYGESVPSEIAYKQRELANKVISKAQSYVQSMGIKNAKFLIKTGIAANEIVKTARDEKVSLIVVGRKSKKGLLEKVLIGSVSQAVINLCTDIDVLITPYTEKSD